MIEAGAVMEIWDELVCQQTKVSVSRDETPRCGFCG